MDRGEERALIARVLAGDRRAARALYDAHVQRTYRLALRITRDPVLAEDVTQDTFIKVFKGLADFRQESRLGTWMHRVTVSLALNQLRAARRDEARVVELDETAAAERPERDPDLAARLEGAISSLPEIYRVPVVLYDIEGRSHAEIADLLGVPEGTCKSRLARARAYLRQELAAYAPEMRSQHERH